MRKNEINARVYRRNTKYIILLWNKYSSSEAPLIYYEEEGNLIPIKNFDTSFPEGLKEHASKVKPNTDICVIDQEAEGINPNKDYTFIVAYGDKKREIPLEVYKHDSLPPTEREDMSKNVHLYAYSNEAGVWQKLSGYPHSDGSLRLLPEQGDMSNERDN